MNKFGKIMAIVGAGLLAVGAICLLIGKLLGGMANLSYVGGPGSVVVTDENIITETVDLEPFEELSIDVTSMDVEIVQGDGYRLEMCVPEKLRAEIVQNNSILKIKEPRINYSFNFNFNSTNRHIYYKVTVPDTDIIKSEISSTSGDILVSDVDLSGKINMTSGDIEIINVESDNLYVHSTSGEIEIENCKIDSLDTENTSGGVELSGVDSEVIKSHTTSGDIVYNNVSADGLQSVSTSGNFEGDKIKAEDVDIESTSGEVKFDIAGAQSEYEYQIKTASGNIEVGTVDTEHEYSTNGDAGKKIRVKTSSGNVNIDFVD